VLKVSWETKKTSWLFFKKVRLERFEMVYRSVASAKGGGKFLVSNAGLTGVQKWVVKQQERNLQLDLSAEKGMLRTDTGKHQIISYGN